MPSGPGRRAPAGSMDDTRSGTRGIGRKFARTTAACVGAVVSDGTGRGTRASSTSAAAAAVVANMERVSSFSSVVFAT